MAGNSLAHCTTVCHRRRAYCDCRCFSPWRGVRVKHLYVSVWTRRGFACGFRSCSWSPRCRMHSRSWSSAHDNCSYAPVMRRLAAHAEVHRHLGTRNVDRNHSMPRRWYHTDTYRCLTRRRARGEKQRNRSKRAADDKQMVQWGQGISSHSSPSFQPKRMAVTPSSKPEFQNAAAGDGVGRTHQFGAQHPWQEPHCDPHLGH